MTPTQAKEIIGGKCLGAPGLSRSAIYTAAPLRGASVFSIDRPRAIARGCTQHGLFEASLAPIYLSSLKLIEKCLGEAYPYTAPGLGLGTKTGHIHTPRRGAAVFAGKVAST